MSVYKKHTPIKAMRCVSVCVASTCLQSEGGMYSTNSWLWSCATGSPLMLLDDVFWRETFNNVCQIIADATEIIPWPYWPFVHFTAMHIGNWTSISRGCGVLG